jgi:septal ring factor EnvC (AmiA/AmiB activator)
MFVRDTLPQLCEQLQGQLAQVDAQIGKLEQQTSYLKQQVKSTEAEMHELLRHVTSTGRH